MDKKNTLLEGLLIRHSQLDKKEIIEGIRDCACHWLDMEGIPASVSDAISALSSECDNELLRCELMELGYDGITERSYIDTLEYCTYLPSHPQHCFIVHWDAKSKVPCVAEGYAEPEAGKYYVEISFASGAFCIGGYGGDSLSERQPFFDRMWEEVVSMNPDSLDNVNHAAYFEIHGEKAVQAWNSMPCILERCETEYAEAKSRSMKHRIAELERELARLKRENLN